MTQEEKNKKIDSLLNNTVSSFEIKSIEDKKQKKIIRLMPEIKKHSALVSENETSNEAKIFCRGFVEGADWRINSIWHDISETPGFDKEILIMGDDGVCLILYWDKSNEKILRSNFIKWAYIKDLLPIRRTENE